MPEEPRKPTRSRAVFYLLIANMLAFLIFGVVFEAAGRFFLWLRPSYEVVFLQPDRIVGWKQVPDHSFTWTGSYWYAAEFSVPVTMNPNGYRDRERANEKAPGVRRLALLGDSFVEALQVPFEQTAAQRLERLLNESFEGGPPPGDRFEVLNFGTSNYGVGQYLLAWEAYIRDFQPDTVMILVSDLQLRRTMKRYETGILRGAEAKRLWVRPTFAIAQNTLVREPARDFDEFVRAQNDTIQTKFGGARSRVRETSVLHHYLDRWRSGSRTGASRSIDMTPIRIFFPVNELVIRELDAQVRAGGARLVIVDYSRFMNREPSNAQRRLRSLCFRERIGYVDLSSPLLRSVEIGEPVTWTYDGHFNDRGNEIFAQALYDWLIRNTPADRKAPGS